MAASVTVTEAGGKQTVYKAKLVGTDPGAPRPAPLPADACLCARARSLQHRFLADCSRGLRLTRVRPTRVPAADKDVAVLKIDAKIRPVSLAKSSSLQVAPAPPARRRRAPAGAVQRGADAPTPGIVRRSDRRCTRSGTRSRSTTR